MLPFDYLSLCNAKDIPPPIDFSRCGTLAIFLSEPFFVSSHKKNPTAMMMKVFRLVFMAVVACVAVSGCAAGSYRRNVLEVEGASAGVNLRTAASGAAAAAATSHDAGTDANGNDGLPVSRTATGGIINTLLSFLTVIAFIGNGAFMVYTFWLSK